MLHTTFQEPEPSSSGEYFNGYFYFGTQYPPFQGQFGPKGHHLNKLGRSPLDNASNTKYQSPKPSGFREDVV